MAWKTVNIRVVLKSDNPVDFDLIPDPSLPKGPGKNDFMFHNEEHHGFLLNYVLQDPTDPDDPLGDYCFPDDPDEALYSAKGVGCPTRKGQWPQFRAHYKPGESVANKVLRVRNLNQKGHEGQFGYTLRLTKTPDVINAQTKYIDLDPGGTNSNGPTSPLHSSYMTVAVVGLAAGVVGALTTVALYDNLICGAR